MKNRKEKIYSILYTLFGRDLSVSYSLGLDEQKHCFFYKKLLVGTRMGVNIEKGVNI